MHHPQLWFEIDCKNILLMSFYFKLECRLNGIKLFVIILHQNMSSIIDDLIFYRWKHQNTQTSQKQYSWQAVEQLSKNLNINQRAFLLNSHPNHYQTLNKLSLQKNEYSIRLKAESKLKSIRVQARLLQDDSFNVINSKHNEILLLKEVARRQFQKNSGYPLCIYKGCVLMVQKMYYFLFEPGHQKKAIEFYNFLFAKNFQEFEQFVCQQSNYIYKTSTNRIYLENQANQDLFISQALCNSQMNFNFTEENSNYFALQQAMENKILEIRRVTKHIVDNYTIENTTNSLFWMIPNQLKVQWIKDNIERKVDSCSRNFEKLLAAGKFVGQKKIDDFIFNMVKLTVKEIVNTPFGQGGSCQLFLAKVQMVFINSVDHTSYFKLNQKKDRIIAIKKLKPQLEKKYKNKLEHEKNIVAKLKGGASYFIPKYYRIEQELEKDDTLLMEYIQGDQLDYFITCRQQTISLWTKICILLNIINGMRHLAGYSITHLDLKPINIIVCRNNFLISKIIDFGEAHHPQVCGDNFSPGYTFPYVSPEAYIRFDKRNETKQQFTFSEKQDVFSFGIIMFQVLFNTKTFQFTQNKFKEVYSCKEILRRFIFAYERIQDYGEYMTTSSLFYLITRCIDPDPAKRPFFDWLAISLRLILNSCSVTN